MVSPARRREAAEHMEQQFDVSQRRACRVISQPRSTQRYHAKRRKDEVELVKQMHDIVRRQPRYGYRRIHVMLCREGWSVNHKRVLRLCRQEGLKVPQKQRKRRRLGHSRNGIIRYRPQHKDHVWAWDFIFDSDERGRSLKWFSLIDEYTRECLALEVERTMTANDVINVLSQVFLIRGVPKYIRSDNGPEFIAHAIRTYLSKVNVGTLYINPGSPWENGYAESYFSRMRDEFLNAELFSDLREAKALASYWKYNYNNRRPHSSLAYRTPAEFAAAVAAHGGSAPKPPTSSPPEGTGRKNTGNHESTLITTGT